MFCFHFYMKWNETFMKLLSIHDNKYDNVSLQILYCASLYIFFWDMVYLKKL